MATCISPFDKRNDKTGEWMRLPCGKCPECLKRRVSGWSYRLVKHGQTSESAHFITLTYNTQTVPISKNGFMSLSKRDLQLFFKRLRKISPKQPKIKYYACGEYGGKTNRPHYHLIIFNADVLLIEKAWQLGEIHAGTVSEASIGYTLKYMCKPSKIPMHRNDDRVPEFALMSKKLGSNYLTPQMINWHKNDLENRMYVALPNGKKIAMPRYFKDKIYNDLERKVISKHIQAEIEKEHDKNHKKFGEKYEQHLVHSYQNKINSFNKNQRIQETF